MFLTSKSFSANSCRREWSDAIEKTSADILTIHDVTAGRFFGIKTDIDLANKTIRKTWKAAGFTWSRSYSLDDFTTAEIQDKSRLMEGYVLPFFVISLSGKGHRLKTYSTDNFEEADSVREQISELF
jgi:hypothetical protein